MKNTIALNATELAKLEKDGLNVVKDIGKFSKEGFAALTAADFDRLKYVGLYIQRPKTDEKFMLRVKIPAGQLNTNQARVLAHIAEAYGHGVFDVTNRHSIQFHWIGIEDVPAIFKALDLVQLTTLQAAGDCPRSIVANPLDGYDPDEFLDTRGIFKQLNDFFHNNRDFSNLPRKYKIAVSGGLYNSVNAELNDVAFVPAVKTVDGNEAKGFNVLVGGGLSREPHLAKKLDIFVLPDEVLKVAAGVGSLFRDYGYREKRNHARLKFLIEDWGLGKFQAKLLKLTGPLQSAGTPVSKGWNAGRFFGFNNQKQAGLSYLGIAVVSGRLAASELREIARLADDYGDGSLRTTNSQDLIILNIPNSAAEQLEKEPFFIKQKSLWNSLNAYTGVCTGNEFCPFGLVETKTCVKKIADKLEEAVGTDIPLRVHISGCGHSCGQPQIADIGLQGAVYSRDGKPYSGFEVWVGGKLGDGARFGKKLLGTVGTDEISEVLADLVKSYRQEALSRETFAEYIHRATLKKITA
ncbi:MAG: nitrite/sulfite reductase [Negativicutes bacterium]|nr:nitrite/sulfite reductase [Negativicutes bacterium]